MFNCSVIRLYIVMRLVGVYCNDFSLLAVRFQYFYFLNCTGMLCLILSLYMAFRSWDTVSSICISVRRMVELDTSICYCHRSILLRLVDSKVYGYGF
jgi:hypothetical membrane protein